MHDEEDAIGAASVMAEQGITTSATPDSDDDDDTGLDAASVLREKATSTTSEDDDDDPDDTDPEKEPTTSEQTSRKDKSETHVHKAEEEDTGEEEFKRPEMDPELAAMLEEFPQLKARWDQHLTGFESLVQDTKAKRQEAREALEIVNHERFGKIMDFASRFDTSDPDTARQAYEDLGKVLSEHHKWEGAPATPTAKALPETLPKNLMEIEVDVSDWQERGFDNPEDFRYFQLVKEATRHELMAEMKPMLDELKAWKAERTTSKQKSEFAARLDKIAEPTIQELKATFAGWAVTRDMVGEAITNLPNLEPKDAVMKWHSAHLAKHMAAAGSRPRGPEMLPTREVKGHELPDPEDMGAADVLAQLRATA